MKNLTLLAIFISLFFTQCTKINYKTVFYNRTLCNDPWHLDGATNAENIMELEKDLKEKGIEYQGINLVNGGVDVDENCVNECICFTGVRITLDVLKEDLDAIKALNFYEE